MQESSWLFLNIDELLFRFHLFFSTIFEWLWYIVSLQWIFGDSSAARALEDGNLGVAEGAGFFDRFFGSGIFRIFNSKPSTEHDSIQEYLNPSADKNFLQQLIDILFGTGDKESIFSLLFGTFFGWVLILGILGYLWKRYLVDKIHDMEHHHDVLHELAQDKYTQGQANDKATRWNKITQQATSDDVNQWKIAIMDADILLDEILTEHGYPGNTVGEKLKDARNSDLTTVSHAWEAHIIRNKIAHDSSYQLTARETKTAISMYERFFNELYHV